MNKITIELSTEQMFRLKAYTKADNHYLGDPIYRTCEEMAAFLVALMTEPNQSPFLDDKESMAVYDREYKRLTRKRQKALHHQKG